MREVSKDVFYKEIGPKDVVGSIVSGYPYKTEYRTRYPRTLIGITEDQLGQNPTRYFLTKDSQ